MQDHGIVIQTPKHGTLALLAEFGFFVADEPAIKSAFGFKGQAGTKLCFGCKDLVQLRDQNKQRLRVDPPAKDIGEADIRQFGRTTHAYWVRAADLVHAPGLTKARIAELSQDLGLTHNPHGILVDPVLRRHVSTDRIIWDWLHVFLCNGLVANEWHELLKKTRW